MVIGLVRKNVVGHLSVGTAARRYVEREKVNGGQHWLTEENSGGHRGDGRPQEAIRCLGRPWEAIGGQR
jgi:hypothetical protein